MKRMFEKALAEFQQHKIIDSVLILLVVIMVVAVVILVKQNRTAAVVVPMGGSSNVSDRITAVSSAAASSSETSSVAVSSSSTSTSSVAASIKVATPTVVSKPTISSTPKASSTAAVKPVTSSKTSSKPITVSKPTTSSAASNNPLYIPIPTSKELQTKSFGGGSFTMNVNAFGIAGYISAKNVKQYIGDDAFFKVTENGTGKVMYQSPSGIVGDDLQIDVATGLDTYQHGTSWWLKPATYTVSVWCKQGSLSQNTATDRPNQVQICTFSFSVYERGFVS